MGTIHLHLPKSLDPAEIEIAASVYETVLRRLNGAEDNTAREKAAGYIMARMFYGERNPIVLSNGALAKLGMSAHAYETLN